MRSSAMESKRKGGECSTERRRNIKRARQKSIAFSVRLSIELYLLGFLFVKFDHRWAIKKAHGIVARLDRKLFAGCKHYYGHEARLRPRRRQETKKHKSINHRNYVRDWTTVDYRAREPQGIKPLSVNFRWNYMCLHRK